MPQLFRFKCTVVVWTTDDELTIEEAHEMVKELVWSIDGPQGEGIGIEFEQEEKI